MDSWMNNIGNTNLKKLYHRIIDSFVIDGAAAIHLLSDLEMQESRKWIRNRNIIVIENGININSKISEKRKKITRPIKLIQIGRIHPQKNNLELIKALMKFPEDEFILDILGPVDDKEYYKKCKKLLYKNNIQNINF